MINNLFFVFLRLIENYRYVGGQILLNENKLTNRTL